MLSQGTPGSGLGSGVSYVREGGNNPKMGDGR